MSADHETFALSRRNFYLGRVEAYNLAERFRGCRRVLALKLMRNL